VDGQSQSDLAAAHKLCALSCRVALRDQVGNRKPRAGCDTKLEDKKMKLFTITLSALVSLSVFAGPIRPYDGVLIKNCSETPAAISNVYLKAVIGATSSPKKFFLQSGDEVYIPFAHRRIVQAWITSDLKEKGCFQRRSVTLFAKYCGDKTTPYSVWLAADRNTAQVYYQDGKKAEFGALTCSESKESLTGQGALVCETPGEIADAGYNVAFTGTLAEPKQATISESFAPGDQEYDAIDCK